MLNTILRIMMESCYSRILKYVATTSLQAMFCTRSMFGDSISQFISRYLRTAGHLRCQHGTSTDVPPLNGSHYTIMQCSSVFRAVRRDSVWVRLVVEPKVKLHVTSPNDGLGVDFALC